jgi:hypothetical protein
MSLSDRLEAIMPNVTPLSVLLFLQAVILGISQLDSLSDELSQVLVIAIIVVNAALATFFQFTAPGKALFARLLIKNSPSRVLLESWR